MVRKATLATALLIAAATLSACTATHEQVAIVPPSYSYLRNPHARTSDAATSHTRTLLFSNAGSQPMLVRRPNAGAADPPRSPIAQHRWAVANAN